MGAGERREEEIGKGGERGGERRRGREGEREGGERGGGRAWTYEKRELTCTCDKR